MMQHELFDGKWQEQKSSTSPSPPYFLNGIFVLIIFYLGYASGSYKAWTANNSNQTIEYTHLYTANTTNNDLKVVREKDGPDHFCSVTSYNVRRTEFRDIICSNYVDNTNSMNHRNNIDVPPTLLPPTVQKIVFLHFPKTGGESLEEALNVNKSHAIWWNRQGEVDNDDNLFITIVRNPYDRMLSWFRFCLHGYKGRLPLPKEHCILAHQLIDRQQNYYEMEEITGLNKTHVSAAFEKWLASILLKAKFYHHWLTIPFLEFIGGTSPLRMDYIIRFEHYQEDFKPLAKALGRNTTLKKVNGSSNTSDGTLRQNVKNKQATVTPKPHVVKLLTTDYREIYTDKARDMIEMRFQQDLLFFNYSF